MDIKPHCLPQELSLVIVPALTVHTCPPVSLSGLRLLLQRTQPSSVSSSSSSTESPHLMTDTIVKDMKQRMASQIVLQTDVTSFCWFSEGYLWVSLLLLCALRRGRLSLVTFPLLAISASQAQDKQTKKYTFTLGYSVVSGIISFNNHA